ncbi:hypothetical protein HME9302_00876 [Alteripontixanthobacter maritimus]|uniref:Glycosyltransferase 2-like domain-containing protein n=1 Tax=Alteripontixanthobacter maritimus TaxID=2161824 RepID=A0A369Q4M8_9SPHN|nr:glycosyltransferase family 2 protein [Alteripontixanthobacter maritimus]RDC59684.1 hypothetical protein HME9302_00876 [Alteripontixanthobacter maritimus]
MAEDSPGQPDLSVLLVNWNTRQMTLECLQSIYDETVRTDFEVIVIDNASKDGSVEAIREQFPQVRLIVETENHGFGRATNIQVKQAQGRKLLLLNTDTVVLDGAIDNLFAFAEGNPEAKIWGGRTLYADKTLNPTSCWAKPTPWSMFAYATGLSAAFPGSALFNPRAYPGWDRDTVRQVDIVTGCLLMIDRDFWKELGGFDPQFFMYGEEADLCLRAAEQGASPMITPDATIIHYDGGSTKPGARKIERTFAATQGMAERHFALGSRWTGQAALKLAAAMRAVGYRLTGKRDAAKIWSEVWRGRKVWSGTKLRHDG